jgi:hypothetical protein
MFPRSRRAAQRASSSSSPCLGEVKLQLLVELGFFAAAL